MSVDWEQVIEEMNVKGGESLTYLTTRYTPEVVREGLRSVATAVGFYIAVSLDEHDDPRHIAGRGLAVYLDSQWQRLQDWESLPCDILAWTTRNLMETYFWTELITESTDNADRFLKEAQIDHRELLEVYFKTKESADDEDMSLYVMKALAKSISGKRIRVKVEDELLFKECSKYIHPSAWLITDVQRHMNDKFARYRFLAFSLHYIGRITTLLLGSHPETRRFLEEEDLA